MLQAIGDRTKTWVSWVLAVVLSLAFGLWGISYYIQSGRPDETVMQVNGIGIQKMAFDQMYRQLRNRFLSSGQVMNTAFEKKLQDESLQILLLGTLLEQAFHKMGLIISDNQVEVAIMRNPLFQVNGVFSQERFQSLLRSNLISEEDYVRAMKKDLMEAQLQQGFLATAFVLPEQINAAYSLLEQSRDVDYLILSSVSNSTSVQFDEAAIKAYYDAHQADYQLPEKVSVEYVNLKLSDLRDKQNISDELVKQYYDANTEMFKTATGKMASLDSVKNQIIQTLKNQKAEEAFAQLKNQLSNLTYANPDSLAIASKTLDLPIQTTDLFSKEEVSQSPLIKDPQFRALAFGEEVLLNKNNSAIFEMPAEHMALVLRFHTHEPAKAQALEVVKPKIIEALRKTHDKEALGELSQKLLATLNQGAAPADLSKQYHITTWHHQKAVTLHDLNLLPIVMKNAFQMLPGQENKMNWQAFSRGEEIVLIGVGGVHYVQPPAATTQNYKTLQEELENTQGHERYQFWLNSLKNSAKITPEKFRYLLNEGE
jgi:peptidyl-prolyl cis-trans isomerase D